MKKIERALEIIRNAQPHEGRDDLGEYVDCAFCKSPLDGSHTPCEYDEAVKIVETWKEDARSRWCEFCQNEIDPDLCWCGSDVEGHSYGDGHSPVPIGCRCGFAKTEDTADD